MSKGILGRKIGMTQVFTANGDAVGVTVIQATPNVVLQLKTAEKDGYNSVQLGFEDIREVLTNKPAKGHAAKASSQPKRFVREFTNLDTASYQLGQEVKVDLFQVGDVVDVTGVSKGKGFTGTIKRNNQTRGPMAHGSRYHRGPGSMGTIAANRVFKGKMIPGRMGFEQSTVLNLEVVKVDVERGLLLVKGNVPGPKKGLVKVKSAVKVKK